MQKLILFFQISKNKKSDIPRLSFGSVSLMTVGVVHMLYLNDGNLEYELNAYWFKIEIFLALLVT